MKPFTLSTTVLSLIGMLSSTSASAGITLDMSAKMQKLLGHPASILNAFEAEKAGLKKAATKNTVWSGSYWPDINGGITNHYRDHSTFGAKVNFGLRYELAHGRFVNDHEDVFTSINEGKSIDLDQKLSPAEKYDLLLGDTQFGFTKAIMEEMDFRAHHRMTVKMVSNREEDTDADEGTDNNFFYEDDANNQTYKRYDDQVAYRYWKKKGGSLAYWTGICDGWATASIYLPRPTKPVTLKGAGGHLITFFPDDIKALGTYLFARTNTPYFATMNYQFAGRKCSERGKPSKDANGFIEDARCNDVDAGVWHLALLNRIGVDRMGFIMDVDNNHKINNHPIASYSLRYLNPKTGKEGTLERSMIARNEIDDKYAKRRNEKTKFLVQVESKIKYMNYIWPEDRRDTMVDHESNDKVREKTYVYDLELDENGNILGGEWANNDQPDFIWMSAPEKLP